MTLENDDPSAFAEKEAIGYGRPPKATRFKKGAPSANPKGRPRKLKASLVEAMAAQLDQLVPAPSTKRGKISRLQLMIRNLIHQAISGDIQAVAEVVRMSKLNENDPPPAAPYWSLFTYELALAARTSNEMDEEFFQKQDEAVAEWKRELKTIGRSLPAMLEIELSRKIKGERNGKVVNTTVREAFIAAAVRAAARKPSLMKKVRTMLPEKTFKRDYSRMQVLRPTAEELERNPAPGESWDDWQMRKAKQGEV
jgi:hypothetical protein